MKFHKEVNSSTIWARIADPLSHGEVAGNVPIAVRKSLVVARQALDLEDESLRDISQKARVPGRGCDGRHRRTPAIPAIVVTAR